MNMMSNNANHSTSAPVTGDQPGRVSRLLHAATPLGLALFLFASATAGQKSIFFKAQVPQLPATMQLFKLSAPAPATEFVNEKLLKLKLPAVQPGGNHLFSLHQQKGLVLAHLDKQTGETVFAPDLESLVLKSRGTQALPEERAHALALQHFQDIRFLPHDDTTFEVPNKVDIMGGSANNPTAKGAGAAEGPHTIFSIVPARRMAAGLPVYGPGSRAVVSLANDGSTHGLLRRWKLATKGQLVKPKLNAGQIQMEITRQLNKYMSPTTDIIVDSISPGYYDGNGGALTPVMYFTAILHPNTGKSADDHVHGYVPLASTGEAVPELGGGGNFKQPATGPQTTVKNPVLRELIHGDFAAGQGAITVGSYINRDGKMLDMWWSFWNGLSLKLPFITPMTPFTLSQYYWAEPWQVNGPSAQSFLNSVNIAYTDPHGNWWYNTTLNNNADGWTIQGITPGFGAGTGGKLATWIIDSCEVAPSYYDLQVQAGNGGKCFDPWWGVFKGLHQVIAFRTEMWLGQDQEEFGFGFDCARGMDVHTAWFQEQASNPSNNQTYLDTNINQVVHYGRGSIFIDARDLGQSIYNVAPQSPSSTLWNFWMGN